MSKPADPSSTDDKIHLVLQNSRLQVALAACTLLGGLAALISFWPSGGEASLPEPSSTTVVCDDGSSADSEDDCASELDPPTTVVCDDGSSADSEDDCASDPNPPAWTDCPANALLLVEPVGGVVVERASSGCPEFVGSIDVALASHELRFRLDAGQMVSLTLGSLPRMGIEVTDPGGAVVVSDQAVTGNPVRASFPVGAAGEFVVRITAAQIAGEYSLTILDVSEPQTDSFAVPQLEFECSAGLLFPTTGPEEVVVERASSGCPEFVGSIDVALASHELRFRLDAGQMVSLTLGSLPRMGIEVTDPGGAVVVSDQAVTGNPVRASFPVGAAGEFVVRITAAQIAGEYSLTILDVG